MPDLIAALRAGGILIPEVMVRAADLENVPYSVAAAILEGESGGGKNIWGADGGLKVRTNGTYTPRTPVTKAAYLAYRTEMRAGRIIRQGCGPCQATSAQYQDVADALGGCWDPLANCRSGFRGMGALIKRYGVQQGARRYNGSGPQAELYGQRFLARQQKWAARLNGAIAPAAPVTVPVPAAYGELMQDKYPLIGADWDIWDVACGSGSFDGRRLFLGVTLFAGTVTGWVDFQNDSGGVGKRQTFALTVPQSNLSPRWVLEVPSGTTKARIGWDATKAQKANLTITGGK